MFQSILSKAVTMLGALLSVIALASMAPGVASAQSGSTGFGGGGSATSNVPAFGGGSGTSAPQFSGGSGTTGQFSGGGSGTTGQFSGGGSGTTGQFSSGGSGTTGQFNGGGSGTTVQPAGAQGCAACGQQQEPVEPPFDCSQCGLPPVPQFNNCGWQYPQLQPSGFQGIFRRQNNCCGF